MGRGTSGVAQASCGSRPSCACRRCELLLTHEERAQLQSFARSRPLPAALSARARIALSGADGEPNNAIAERLALTKATGGASGASGLSSDASLACTTTFAPQNLAQSMTNTWLHLIKTTLHSKPFMAALHAGFAKRQQRMETA